MLFKISWSIPVPMPSLMLPKIANGPIAKSKEAATKPSTNGESLDALNLIRKVSPSESKRSSSLRADPINPPTKSDPSTTSNVQPCGSASMYRSDHKGINADPAPRRVTKPNTSVKRVRVRRFIRFPTRTPSEAPEMIVTILMIVPTPGNIC